MRLLVLTPDAARELGLVAEAVAAEKYKFDMGRTVPLGGGKAGFFSAPPGVDFFDISHGFGNTSLYAAFLVDKHPALSPSRILELSDNKLVKIPDLTTFLPGTQTEFYEIEPNSPSGLTAGAAKIAAVSALYARFGLPYVPGMRWTLNFRFILFSGSILGIKVDVFLHIFRRDPGLVVYEVCADGKSRSLTNAEVAAIIAIVLIAVLAAIASDGVLIPALAGLLAV